MRDRGIINCWKDKSDNGMDLIGDNDGSWGEFGAKVKLKLKYDIMRRFYNFHKIRMGQMSQKTRGFLLRFIALFLFLGASPIFAAPADHFVLKVTTTAANESFYFYTNDTNYDIDWDNDGLFDSTGVSGIQASRFASAGEHIIRFRYLSNIHIANQADAPKYTSIEQWGTAVWDSNMKEAFQGAKNLKANYTDTPKMSIVTDMGYMFDGAESFNGSVANWDTPEVQNMIYMFRNAKEFDQNMNSWDTSKVINMVGVFQGATKFNGAIGDWNTSKSQNMFSMFQDAKAFNQDLSTWDVSKVTSTAMMFLHAEAFNQGLAWGGKTSSIVEMYNMFDGAKAFNQDISGWDVSNVTNMQTMFGGATAFNQDLSSWDLTDTSADAILDGTNLSIRNYDRMLNQWMYDGSNDTHNFSVSNVKHCLGAGAITEATTAPKVWSSVSDGGSDCSGFALGTVTIVDGGDERINATEKSNDLNVTVGMHSDAQVNDILHLHMEGNGTVYDLNHTVTQADIDANTTTITIPSANLPANDGDMNVSVAVTTVDAHNEAPASVDTTIIDTTAPAITLTGANPQTIEAGTAYSELGATAQDNIDGDISGNIVIDTSAVDTNTVGDYNVTYDVNDSSGNAATQMIRIVKVVDTTAPAITLTGANPQTIEAGTAYSELGATAQDNIDGDISGNIVIDTSAVDTNTVGDYNVTYDVNDSSGNAATQMIRIVKVVDTTAPAITLTGANPQTIEAGTAYSELGATAQDNIDGDISGNIVIDTSAVDTNTVGDYNVTYDVNDSSGNAATQMIRIVKVVDTTAPAITLTGANPQTIEAGTAYSELGATAQDNIDGDISGNIVIDTSAVDTNTVGDYNVTYDVNDSSGNAATQMIRIVKVVDTTAPAITLTGANPQTIEAGTAYSELGATAQDNIDGDISGNIVIDTSAVDTNTVGDYNVTYDVNDSSGNAATQMIRIVKVVDTTAPAITLTGANPQTIEAGTAYSELGATAQDNIDGDISGNIVIDTSAVDTNTVGDYNVTYDVNDSSGNAATQMIRIVKVVDTTAPAITLTGANPQTIEAGTAYSELGATAQDNIDGDISGNIVIDTSAVDTNTVGDYNVTYDVNDSSGNAATQMIRIVKVVDTTAPAITLTGANPQTIEAGTAYSELGATAQDNIDGDISGNIVIDTSAVDTNTVGDYNVTYDVNDSSGNAATQMIRIVKVVDTTAPAITLTGANPQTIEAGTAYSELGATAQDNIDGDISGNIVIDTSAVDTNTVGDYNVTYDVNDSSGNAATQMIRIVKVVDTTAPAITLTGANPQTIEAGTAYSELGATAQDNIDGDISGNIVIDTSAVDTNTVGDYNVTYDVNDSSGNAATQMIRIVKVVDTTAPAITLTGANPQTIEAGTAYSELGATAQDNIDGDISGNIVIDTSAVDTNTVGDYNVTYDVNDSSGNAATQMIRIVKVVDTTAPAITLTGANPQTIEAGTAYSELGATAQDNIDGDISGNIVIDTSAVDTNTVGDYNVTYDVNDSSGNAATQMIRIVKVVDTTAPAITLTGANPQTIEAGTAYSELGATAQDNIDGDISGNIVIDTSAVDTNTVGDYNVTYDVNDSSGNAATQMIRIVKVVDTTAPAITLTGANPQTIEAGTAYSELGATAQDNIDGDISGNIVIDTSAVDTNTVGDYNVTYDVNDSSGNAATQMIRIVKVVDTTAPAITLTGANPQTIEAGTAYSELGATAQDNIDGDISGNIVIDTSAVDTNTVGDYNVTYDVNDSSGNAATQMIRIVKVVDTTAPAITLTGANPQTIEAGTAYSELGATAQDNIDGDISGNIVIDTSAVDTNTVGDYNVTYDVNDSSGNAATQMIRIVKVVDTTAPAITLTGANPQTIEAGTAYSELGATAQDNIDGDISGNIVIDTSAVDTNTVGDYNVTYDVNDSSGNAATQMIRIVKVVDTTAPAITLTGANPQTIEAGTAYSELGATAQDNIDGDISGNIVIDTSAVDTNTVGDYNVTYDVNDSSGNAATQMIRIVKVVDTTAPAITLTGANPQTIEAGTAYSELGATAQDNIDGDISGNIVIDTSAVDTNTVGDYNVTYDVNDSSGNAATQMIRIVKVVDTTAPAITLTGANPQTIEAGTAYSELGATAQDNIDGDISGNIVIDTSAVDTNTVGDYNVTYDVNDSSGNAATQMIRIVKVVDTTAPAITLTGANPQTIEAGTAYSELGATAQDNIDGDISGNIVIDTSAVDTNTVGDYNVTYDVNDSSGNAATQMIRIVKVVDTTAPAITLTGANPQTIEAGTAYSELGATAQDNIDGDISGNIVIDTSAVDTNTVGDYNVTYDVNDSSGNAAVQMSRLVHVVDTGLPVIALNGDAEITIIKNHTYTEQNATATDGFEGNLTVTIGGDAVDTATLGDYNVTYTATDSSGNTQTISRMVHVITDPLLTAIGTDANNGDNANTGDLNATVLNNIIGVSRADEANNDAYKAAIAANDPVMSSPATIAQVQAMIDQVNAVKISVDAGNGDSNTTQDLLTAAGITPDNLTPEQLAQINESLDNATPKPTTKEELQALVDAAVAKADAVKVAVDAGNGDGNITQTLLTDANITPDNLTPEQLAQINESLDNATPKPTTKEELQALVDVAVAKADAVKVAVDAGNGDGNITQTLLTDANITPDNLTPEQLAQINESLDNATPKPTTKEELQALVDAAVAKADAVKVAVDAGNGDGNITQTLLTDANITPDNLTPEQLAQINESLDNATPKPTTKEELQALVDAAVKDQTFKPVKDSDNNKVGYEYQGKDKNVTEKEKSKVEVDPKLIGNATIEIETDGEGKQSAGVVVGMTDSGVCDNGIYEAYAVINEDGKVKTGFRGGAGCEKYASDPTASTDGFKFVKGTHARINETDVREKREHNNAGMVIIDDIVVPIGSPVELGGK